jgi:RHS repeat-associated protein
LRQAVRVTSEDAGERRMLRTVLGEPFRSWNSRGFVTTLDFDAARRPLRTVVTRPDASTFTAVRIVYGESVASPQAQNLRGQVFRVYDGAGLQQSNAFDFKGNLVSQSRQLTVAYDGTPSWSALDGLTTITDLDAATAALLEAETFTTTATFDALGRPVTQTTPDASVLQLDYDDGGKLRTVSGNVRGAVTPTDFVTSIEYDARGQRQRIDYGNGTRTEYEHDPLTFRLRRLHTTNTAGTVTHQDLRYTFDPVGNITEIRDLAQPVVFTSNAAVSADQRFVYDALYRLVQSEGREHGSQGQPVVDDFIPRAVPDDPTGLRAYVESYTYDLVGNILQMQHQAPGGNWTRHYHYAASGNRLLATSAPGDGPGVFSHAYQYNAHGSMTAMPHLAAVEWDHADRMQSADLGGGGTVWFLYDAAGNRVRKIRVNHSGSSTYERIYLGGYEIYREHVGIELRLDRQTLHVADDTGRICLVETKTVDDGDAVPLPANISRYQYGNHLGSVGMELDETGQLISYEEFHPYGTTAYRAANSAVDVSASRYRYTGKERDEETGLGHHGARYYASWFGRWTAADPAGMIDGTCRYQYVRGNPVRHLDREGLSPYDAIARTPTPRPAVFSAGAVNLNMTRPQHRLTGVTKKLPSDPSITVPIFEAVPGALLRNQDLTSVSSRALDSARGFPEPAAAGVSIGIESTSLPADHMDPGRTRFDVFFVALRTESQNLHPSELHHEQLHIDIALAAADEATRASRQERMRSLTLVHIRELADPESAIAQHRQEFLDRAQTTESIANNLFDLEFRIASGFYDDQPGEDMRKGFQLQQTVVPDILVKQATEFIASHGLSSPAEASKVVERAKQAISGAKELGTSKQDKQAQSFMDLARRNVMSAQGQ